LDQDTTDFTQDEVEGCRHGRCQYRRMFELVCAATLAKAADSALASAVERHQSRFIW
jgi:hypothetical protein